MERVIEKYGIKTNGATLVYEPNMSSTLNGANPNPGGLILIGPNAFKSDSYLGQIIGHEYRHEQQRDENRNHNDRAGASANEAEAYLYNIRNASRFGSSSADVAEFTRKFEEHFKNQPESVKRVIENYDYTTP